jgi:hypothetical protein
MYRYRCNLAIDHTKVAEDQVDFPVFLNICDESGIDGADLTPIFDELGASSLKMSVFSGVERFVEQVDWDTVNERAELHTTLNISSVADTPIKIYYDSEAVDNVGYVGATGSTPAMRDDSLVTGGTFDTIWYYDTGQYTSGSYTYQVAVESRLYYYQAVVYSFKWFYGDTLTFEPNKRQYLKIGTTDYNYIADSIRITDKLESRAMGTVGVYSESYPKAYQTIDVYHKHGVLIFSGLIETVTSQRAGTTNLKIHQLDLIDNHYLADKKVVATYFEDMLAGDIVKALWKNYLEDEGVTLGIIEDGGVIRHALFNYLLVSKCLDQVAEKTSFVWYIDKYKRLNFHSRLSVGAPFTLTDLVCRDITVMESNPQYRNRQYIIGGRDLTDEQIETRRGDGDTQAFPMAYKIAKEPVITLNGYDQEVGIRGLDEGMDWYWSKGDSIISQELANEPISTEDELVIRYVGEWDVVALIEDSAEVVNIQTREGSGTGYIEAVDSEKVTANRAALFQSASQKLARFGKIDKIITCTTHLPGLAAGQILDIDLPHHLPNNNLLITSVDVSEQGQRLVYSIEGTTGASHGDWTTFFQTIYEQSVSKVSDVTIGDKTILSLLYQPSESLGITESVTFTVKDTLFPANDLYPSNSLYPNG